MVKSVILAILTGGPSDAGTLEAALAAARLRPAHVKALHVQGDPLAALTYGGPEALYVREELLAAAERETAERAQRVRRGFERWSAENDLPIAEVPQANAAVTASLVVEGGDALARHGRLADLVVIANPTGADDGGAAIDFEAALFETGRPVLLVPHAAASIAFERVLIAWKSSAEASRAVAAALPILQSAREVAVFAATEREAAPTSADDLIGYLGWHGVAARGCRFDGGAPSVGHALLREADRMGARLLVMGGYSHSRLRQFILGGVTRHVVENATLPILIAH